MEAVAISWVALIGGLLIPLTAILAPVFLIVLFLIFLRPGRSGKSDPEETRMIQEIYRGLDRLESRVENLETLVIDKEKSEPAGAEW